MKDFIVRSFTTGFGGGYNPKFPGGWGIVLDDVIAGLYTALAVYLIIAIH